MKFDQLYKLMVNTTIITESDELEDASELNQDSETINPDISSLSTTTTSSITPRATMSNEEKVEYLLKHSQIINKNPNKTEAEKRAIANYMVENGFFEAMLAGIADRELDNTDPLSDDQSMNSINTPDINLDDQDGTVAPDEPSSLFRK
jgi:hypothetical protein